MVPSVVIYRLIGGLNLGCQRVTSRKEHVWKNQCRRPLRSPADRVNEGVRPASHYEPYESELRVAPEV